MASRLNKLDKKLIDAWSDLHGPMCDDTCNANEEDKRRRGCDLLDWSHSHAHQLPVKIGRFSVPAFVTQGTYQDLADLLAVGWHPDFRDFLSDTGEPN